jgi:hypothetical protein
MLQAMQHFVRLRLAAILAIALAAPAATADPAWDAAEVTRLATELHAILGEGLALSSQAPPQETAFQQRTRDAAVKGMQRAHEIAGEYAEKVRGGWSREDSGFFFHQLRSSIADARETAGDAVPSARNASLFERVDQLVREIGAYYTAS